MGGTSTDVSLVEGAITTASHAEVAGLPIGVPMLDIHTVGAGGGSLARFDAAGVLRVGPESAGADPGPICYGRGTQPTVTDANLLLGRLQPTRFLGGDFTLDLDRTRRVTGRMAEAAGKLLSLLAWKFAAGVIRVVNATMEKAIRVVSIERGRDPRDFALVAFGGAGGLHACALAEALSIPHVIVPALPGALSALGILVSDVVKDYSRTVLWRCHRQTSSARWIARIRSSAKQAAKDFQQEAWQGRVHYQQRRPPLPRPGIRTQPAVHQKSSERIRTRTPAPLRLRPSRSRSRAGNPPSSRVVKSHQLTPAESHHRPCGDGRPRPSKPSKARRFPLAPKPQSYSTARNSHTAIYSARSLAARQKILRPRHRYRIQRHDSHPRIPDKRFHLDPAANLIVTIR
jgi:hypothetical protein